jgi:hypothetical protein
MAAVRLGKKLGVVHDPRTLEVGKYLTRKLPNPPARVNHSSGVGFQMLGNDRYGDCTVAGAANLERAWSRGKDAPDATAVVDAYMRLSGGQDTGLYSLDVLAAWRKGQLVGRPILAFAKVDLQPKSVHIANWLFGGVYVGWALPSTVEGAAAWKDVSGVPGSWGGHLAPVVDSDGTGGRVASWGDTIRFSWDFFKRYADEAYAVISPDWLDRHHGKSPQGFSLEELQADLQEVTA